MLKKIVLFIFFISFTVFSLEIKDGKVYDENGNSIEFKNYNRIVVYNLGVVEILYKLGAGEKIVGIANHKKSVWPEDKTNKIPLAGNISKPSIEKILEYNPDLVLFNIMGNKEEELKKFGVPSLVVTNRSLNEILNNIEILGKLVGKEEEGKKLKNELDEKRKKIKEKNIFNGKALLLYTVNPPTTFARGSLPGEILELLGIKVITPISGEKVIVSSEYMLKENPDYIIGTRGIKNSSEIINSLPLIKETKAYKNGKIISIDSQEILRGSHRVFDEIEKVEKNIEMTHSCHN